MSSPEYSATIEFPARFIDAEIQELLAREHDIKFKEPDPREQDHELELAKTEFGEIEVKIERGVFFFHDGQARNGEFYELEELLIKKGIPFDRESGMDWNAPPSIRIFRPGPPVFDHTDSTPDAYDEVVSVSKIRELMGQTRTMHQCFDAISRIEKYLDETFPAYAPLADFVGVEKEVSNG